MRSLWATFQLEASRLMHRLSEQRGQTMAEYGILIGVIAIVVVAVAVVLGHNISTLFSSVAGRV
jgi:pilus assembly protein Flp/PilA